MDTPEARAPRAELCAYHMCVYTHVPVGPFAHFRAGMCTHWMLAQMSSSTRVLYQLAQASDGSPGSCVSNGVQK